MMNSRVLRNILIARNRKKLVRSYLGRNPRSAGLPLYVVIESTNRCNLDCVMCPRTEMNRSTGNMDFDLFKEIIDQVAPTVDFLYLHLFGEPLLNKHILEMIAYGGEKGLKIGLSTNITLLDKDVSQAILAGKLSFLILACDGYDEESFRNRRKGVDFAVVLRNMESFRDIRRQAGGDGPRTVVQTIKFPDMSEDYEEQYKKFWEGFGADNVCVKRMQNWAHQSEKVNAYSLESDHPLDDSRDVCVEPWRGLAIYWDGRVVPCCNDYSGKEILGDLKRQTIAEVWNSERYADFRKMHASGNRKDSALCRKCDFPAEDESGCSLKSSLFRPSTSELLYYGLGT